MSLIIPSIEPDSMLKSLVMMLLTILLMSLFLKKLNQPDFVAYIIAGILLGPWGIKILNNPDTIFAVGELGLIIQMFFIGMK